MKIILAISLLTFSLNSFATGGFFCNAEVKNSEVDVTIQISGTTARVIGNPLVSELHLGIDEASDLQFKIPLSNVVGYWNMDSLLVHTISEDAMQSTLLLKYDLETNLGSLEIDYQGIKGTTNNITCEFE